jgi:hypothetical protein
VIFPEAIKKRLRKRRDSSSLVYLLYHIRLVTMGHQPICLDYPVKPRPRYGYGKPAHPELTLLLSRGAAQYRDLLREFLELAPELLAIPLRDSADPGEPCWINHLLDGLDTFALYGFIATRSPRLYVEVGSGFSTKVVRRAIKDRGLATRLISIDPSPRREIDQLCDDVVRMPLEDCDLGFIDDLQANDIFFLDGSHRSFMNSDVTVFFLEILPRLKPGVIVHIHDIYLPFDYLSEGCPYYSEQYLLAASLLAGHNGYDILLPNNFVSNTPSIADVLKEFWSAAELRGVKQKGTSFWLVRH